jgi:RNA polymerase sigma-70 factor (ECF subfamily)
MTGRSINPELWIDRYGDELYRYALSLLGEESDAEDAVQETFAAAIRTRTSFSGNSSEKTWLFGILKHKITDHFRRKYRSLSVEGTDGEKDDPSFLENGAWVHPPLDWGNPDLSLENKEFWKVFEECVKRLSLGVSRVFLLKVIEEKSLEEICKELEISPANCGVRMFRARMGLRKCLEAKWFDKGSPPR